LHSVRLFGRPDWERGFFARIGDSGLNSQLTYDDSVCQTTQNGGPTRVTKTSVDRSVMCLAGRRKTTVSLALWCSVTWRAVTRGV